MEIDAEPGPGDLRHTAGRLWRRRWWIVGAIVVVVAISLGRSLRATEVYSSRTFVRQADPNSFVVFETRGASSAPDPERQASTQIEIVRSAAVEELVRTELGARFAAIEDLSINPVGDTDILSISIRSADATVARDAANAYGRSYLQVSQATQVRVLEQQAEELSKFNRQNQQRIVELSDEIERLDAEIAELGPAVARGSGDKARYDAARSERQLADGQRSSLLLSTQTLEQRVVQLEVEASARRDVAGQVLRPAILPTSPVSPTPARDALVAAMVGGLLGLALASARDVSGGKLQDVESVTRVAPHVPVLGTPMQLEVPNRASASAVLITLGDSYSAPALEAYRDLRTSIQSATLGSTLLVTSPGVREGKTTTVANLGGSLARAGATVCVACLDLHRPNLHELFSHTNAVGLTSVLLGTHGLDEALIPIEGTGGTLRLLASGPLPPSPSELLGSVAVGELIAQLRARFDYVLLDAPPVMSVTDPIVASLWSDHVLLVVRCGQSTSRGLRVALDRLQRAGVEPFGLVFNGAKPSKSSAYYYAGYGGGANDDRITQQAWDRVIHRNGTKPRVEEASSLATPRVTQETSGSYGSVERRADPTGA